MAGKTPNIKVVKNKSDKNVLMVKVTEVTGPIDPPMLVSYKLKKGDKKMLDSFDPSILKDGQVEDYFLSMMLFASHTILSNISGECSDLSFDLMEAGYDEEDDEDTLGERIDDFRDTVDEMSSDIMMTEISFSRLAGAAALALTGASGDMREDIRASLAEAIEGVMSTCRKTDGLIGHLLDELDDLDNEVDEYIGKASWLQEQDEMYDDDDFDGYPDDDEDLPF